MASSLDQIGPLAQAAEDAEIACANLTKYDALAAADTVHTKQAFDPAVNVLVSGADVSGPSAQAQFHSIDGSNAWAGAPYSSTVDGSSGLVAVPPAFDPVIPEDVRNAIPFYQGITPNDVPTFAVSSHPFTPKGEKSTPVAKLNAESTATSSKSSAVAGALASPDNAVGRADAMSTVSCGADTTIDALAENDVAGIDLGGVLTIGRVHTRAHATVDPSGAKTQDSSIEIENASVAGHAVTISEQGVALAGDPTALPSDPVTPALKEAGVTVQYLAAAKDDGLGQILSPGLAISVTQPVASPNGTFTVTTTYVIGRGLARASLEPGLPLPLDDLGDDVSDEEFTPLDEGAGDAFTSFDPGISEAVTADFQSAGAGRVAARPAAQSPAGSSANVATSRIADWSIAPGYTALGIGALLLLAAWVGLERIAVRLRWR